MLEEIAIALAIKFGSGVIDRVFFQQAQADTLPVIGQEGRVGFADVRDGRSVIGREFATPRYDMCETVIGNVFLHEGADDVIASGAITIVVILEEVTLQPLVFEIDPYAGFEVCLPGGIYSFYVFLLDSDANSLLDAEIYGFGQPSAVDLSGASTLQVDPPGTLYDLLDDSLIEIGGYGRRELDMILVDASDVPDLPAYFSDFPDNSDSDEWEPPLYDLTGVWQLQESYEFGNSVGEVSLFQAGNALSGVVNSEHAMSDGGTLIAQELVEGVVDGASVTIQGTQIRSLTVTGSSWDYYLDQWIGTILSDVLIAGEGQDEAGTPSQFRMRRLAYGA